MIKFRPKSKELIQYAKNGDIESIKSLLERNRYLVYDYDSVHQTALHWAAKRNYPDVIKLLVSYGSFIDAKTLGDRTPLFLASKWGNIRAVKALLAKEANPKAKNWLGYTAMDVAASESILSYLK